MITRVNIEGYKSIKSLQLELLPVNILLGSNGVGKSNLISVFSLLRNLYNENLQDYIVKKGGPDSLLYFGRKITDKISLSIEFGSDPTHPTNEFKVILGVAQDKLIIQSTETAFYSYSKWHPKIWERNIHESNFRQHNTGQAFWVNDRLKEFDVYHFHDTSDTSPIKGMSNIEDSVRLKRDGSNLAAFLYYLQEVHPKSFRRIELTISQIAPFFEGFDLRPSRFNEQNIQLEWREIGHPEAYFNAYHLSDGTLRFICLATLLMQPNPPKTIIIDEPELGLHPVAINQLAALIRKAAEKVQVIISTQSTNLIDNFNAEDIIVTDKGENGSEFRRLNSSQLEPWLSDYTLGDIWGKNLIGAQPHKFR